MEMHNEISSTRTSTGLSQRQFALALHISVRTLREWEQGRRKPSGSAYALIDIARKHPKIIQESFETHQANLVKAVAMLNDMANFLLARDEIAFSDLILDWQRDNIQFNTVPFPKDNDKIRLAVKASILDRLVEVLNSPPHNASQSAPSWCNRIPALDAPLKLQSDRLLEDEQYCSAFEKRNLYAVRNFMFFV